MGDMGFGVTQGLTIGPWSKRRIARGGDQRVPCSCHGARTCVGPLTCPLVQWSNYVGRDTRIHRHLSVNYAFVRSDAL